MRRASSASWPALRELADKGAKVIVLSHFGRPKGKPDPESSMRAPSPMRSRRDSAGPVAFAEDCIGAPAEDGPSQKLADGEVLMLENARFHKGEEANDPAFVAAVAKLGDLFVNDAFSAAHRAHATTEGPRARAAGLCRAAPCRPSSSISAPR